MAAFEEIRDADADLHSELRKRRNVFVSRPAYTEEAFQSVHEETTKERVPIATQLKQRLGRVSLSCRALKKMVLSLVPILSWLPKYDVKTTLASDALSGFTVGIFRIPHGMAHAILADVSPIYGLYTSFFPPIVYAIFGTSRQLNIGTFAVVSIMTGTAIDKVMEVMKKEMSQAAGAMTTAETLTLGNASYGTVPPPASFVGFTPAEEALERAKIGALLALMVGLMQIGMSVFRLGFVTCYLAEPLVRGFTTGAAFHVFTSQFNKLFAIPIQRYAGPFALPKTYRDFFLNIDQTNPSALINSVICILILIFVKELQDKLKDRVKLFKYPLPTELVIIIFSTTAAFTGDFSEKYGMPIVGEISATSLPAPFLPSFKYASLIISDAFVIAIVIFSVSVSLSFIFAKRNKYEVSSNQELLGYGTSNIIPAFFYCYPCSGSLSRSLLQELAGGKTQLAGIISTFPILLVLFLLTHFFQSLPVGCLAAIVVVALRGMFRQFRDIKELWKFSKIDCMLWIITCLAVILLGVDLGLLAGVAVAIFSVILRTQRPKCAMLGHIPDTDIYRDVNYYNAASDVPGIKIFRVNAPIYFTNAEYIKGRMYTLTGINPPKILQEQAKEERRQAKSQAQYRRGREARRRRGDGGRNGSAPVVMQATECGDLEESGQEMAAETTVLGGGKPETTHPEAELIELEVSSSTPTADSSERDWTNGVRTIIVDMGAVSFVDAMGLSTLKVIVADYEKLDVNVIMANCRGPIRTLMIKSGFMDLIGLDKIYVTLHDAVLHHVDKEDHLLTGPSIRLKEEPSSVVRYHRSSSSVEKNMEPSANIQVTGSDSNI